MSRYVTGLLLVVATCLLAVACRPIKPPTSGGGSLHGFVPVDCGLFTPDDYNDNARVEAMLSVHAHAYFAKSLPPLPGSTTPRYELPAHVGVSDLEQSVRFLRCDPHPAATSRRRRAVAKLLAYGWGNGRFDRALGILGANVPLIRTSLVALFPTAADLTFVIQRPLLLEYRLGKLIVGQGEMVIGAAKTADQCDGRPEAPYATPSIGGGYSQVTAETYVSVGLPRATVAANIDPQKWDDCSALWPADGTYLVNVVPDTSCHIQSKTSAPAVTPGSLYTGRLYERFQCYVKGCNFEFETVLDVETSLKSALTVLPGKTVDAHHVQINLAACKTDHFDGFIGGTIDLGLGKKKANLDLDDGRMDAWTEMGRTHVLGHKRIGLGPQWNGSVKSMLISAELNQQLQEMVCCTGGP